MALGFWSLNPPWHNFSSLYREACTASDASTDMEKSHHLAAALYFGIACLEAFLNHQMREHLASTKSQDEIFEVLRTGRFTKKLTAWPMEITGRPFPLGSEAIELIKFCHNVRGDLTHPKTLGHDLYDRLFEVTPSAVVDAVAQYIVSFHQAQGVRYPYWVFGWNYLNPRPDSHEIILIHDQQFCHSLAALGFAINSYDSTRAEAWKDKYMTGLDGYALVRDMLKEVNGCEPKASRFPFQPKLCRLWWNFEHHRTCGHVTQEALAIALRFDEV